MTLFACHLCCVVCVGCVLLVVCSCWCYVHVCVRFVWAVLSVLVMYWLHQRCDHVGSTLLVVCSHQWCVIHFGGVSIFMKCSYWWCVVRFGSVCFCAVLFMLVMLAVCLF